MARTNIPTKNMAEIITAVIGMIFSFFVNAICILHDMTLRINYSLKPLQNSIEGYFHFKFYSKSLPEIF